MRHTDPNKTEYISNFLFLHSMAAVHNVFSFTP